MGPWSLKRPQLHESALSSKWRFCENFQHIHWWTECQVTHTTQTRLLQFWFLSTGSCLGHSGKPFGHWAPCPSHWGPLVWSPGSLTLTGFEPWDRPRHFQNMTLVILCCCPMFLRAVRQHHVVCVGDAISRAVTPLNRCRWRRGGDYVNVAGPHSMGALHAIGVVKTVRQCCERAKPETTRGISLRKKIDRGVRLWFSNGYPWLEKIWSKTYP